MLTRKIIENGNERENFFLIEDVSDCSHRFRTFEHSSKEIFDMVDSWERQTGALRPMTPPGGAEQQEELNQHPPSGGRKTKKGVWRHLYLSSVS